VPLEEVLLEASPEVTPPKKISLPVVFMDMHKMAKLLLLTA